MCGFKTWQHNCLFCRWLYNILCSMLSFWFPLVFWWNDFFAFFTQWITCRGKEKNLKFILNTILNVHPYINIRIKVYQLFRNFVCDIMHNNSFGLWLTDVNEINEHIVFILDKIITSFYQWFYDILCAILSFLILVYLHFLV